MRTMIVLSHSINYWLEFDGWCLTKGIEPLEMPSRRYFAAVWYWMTEHADEEQLDKIHAAIDQSVYEMKIAKLPPKKPVTKTDNPEKKEDSEEKKVVPNKRWEAPPGWKPPGWKSDEEAYRNAQGFMGWQAGGMK